MGKKSNATKVQPGIGALIHSTKKRLNSQFLDPILGINCNWGIYTFILSGKRVLIHENREASPQILVGYQLIPPRQALIRAPHDFFIQISNLTPSGSSVQYSNFNNPSETYGTTPEQTYGVINEDTCDSGTGMENLREEFARNSTAPDTSFGEIDAVGLNDEGFSEEEPRGAAGGLAIK